MKKSIQSTGSRLEPGTDNLEEWSFPREGTLELDEDSTRFGDWVIPNTKITAAVLNSERFLVMKRQTLLIKCDEGKYIFGFNNPVENDFIFPFDVRITERRSFIGKLMLFAIAIFLLNILWQILKYTVNW